MKHLSERDIDTLHELAGANRNLEEVNQKPGWAKPMDFGASNGSHHSDTLHKLARKGFVMMSRTRKIPGNSRPGKRYHVTAEAIELLTAKGLKPYKRWPTIPPMKGSQDE